MPFILECYRPLHRRNINVCVTFAAAEYFKNTFLAYITKGKSTLWQNGCVQQILIGCFDKIRNVRMCQCFEFNELLIKIS